MKRADSLIIHLVITVLLLVPVVSVANDAKAMEIFNQADKYYMDQAYDKAAEYYEKLVAINKVSPEVYYNLGNAYYKSGNIAAAILNYERAKRLRPSDEDIDYNLRMANLHTIDKIEPVPKVFYEKWFDDFVNEGSAGRRAAWITVFFWIAFIFAAIYLFAPGVFLRKIMFFSAIIALLVGITLWYMTFLQREHLNNHKAAIIFSESSFVKSSPTDESANLFMLHAGTRIEVLDELKGWKKIRIANGNEGWINAEAIQVI
jgi:tetratricopeptide (TPR) repeat protein